MSGNVADEIAAEVEKDIARENALNFVRKNQNLIILSLTALAFALLAYYYYHYRQEDISVKKGEDFFTALSKYESGKTATLDPILEDKDNPYRYIALIKKLDYAQNSADPASVEKIAEENEKNFFPDLSEAELKKQNKQSALFRDLAKLRLLYILQDDFDDAEFDKKTAPLIQNDFSFRASARELVALRAMDKGDTKKAEELLTKILQDPYAPNTLRERATLYLQTIKVEQDGATVEKITAPGIGSVDRKNAK